jgi:hypothetical protein
VWVNTGVTLAHGTGNLSLVGAANVVGVRIIKLLGYNSTWNMIG